MLCSGVPTLDRPAAAADANPSPLAVEVMNASEPQSCAEKDNVTVTFASSELRHFRIQAAHPAYIGGVTGESREPDWTDCDIVHGGRAAADRAPHHLL